MYLAGQSICDLFLYTPVKNSSLCVQVKRDEVFLKNVIEKSEDFYFRFCLPRLSENKNKDSDSENVKQPKRFFGTDRINIL